MLLVATVALAVGLAAATAEAKPTVSATYAQTGPRTLQVNTSIAGTPRNAWVIVETKRFGPGTAKKARKVQRRLPRTGRSTLIVRLPAGSKAVTARVRVEVRTKRVTTVRMKNRKAKRVTRPVVRRVGAGRWKTVRFARGGRVASVATVRPGQIQSITPPTSTAAGSIHLSGNASRVKRNQVIAMGITPATPEGLLVRVTDITRNSSGAIVGVVPARLSDVVPAGTMDVTIPVAKVARLNASEQTTRALECTSGRSATASAVAELSSGLSLSAGWTGGSLLPPRTPQLTATLNGKVQARLEGSIVLDGQAACTLTPVDLFPKPIRLASFTVQVGPVPVPIIIDGQVTLNGKAEASGSLTTRVKARAEAEAGVTYKSGRFTPTKKFDRQFTFDAPAVNGTGSAEVSLSPSIGVRMAGAAGPEIDLTGGLKLTGDLAARPGQPWWKLSAPVSLGAKFKLDLWGIRAESERFQLWSEEPVIAQADPSSGAPGSSVIDQGLAPVPLPQGVKTRLTWDSNTDVDLHTWNQWGQHAFYLALNDIDGGYLDQDVIPGYGPETFYETDPDMGNVFTFGVCQYSGENANVTVDVRDTNGATRRFLVVLRGRKAAALLTTSPVGATPYIDASTSWCNSEGTDPTRIGEITTGTFGD